MKTGWERLAIRPGDEKAVGRPSSSLPVTKMGLEKKRQKVIYTWAGCDRARGNVFKANKERFRLDIRNSLLWQWWGAGTGCPEMLWILHPWKCLRPEEICSNGWCACSGSRGRTRWFFSSFQPKLLFWNSMILSALLRIIFGVSFLIPALATLSLTRTAVSVFFLTVCCHDDGLGI